MPDHPQPEPTESEWLQVRELLGRTATSLGQRIWTDDEVFRAFRANIRSHLKAGWKWIEGRLRKGEIEAVGNAVMPNKSGQPDFDPHLDAFAVRVGATFVSDNRYFHEGTGQFMDRNANFVPWLTGEPGQPRDEKGNREETECPECGGMRWYVKKFVGMKDGHIPLYENTYCRRCVTPEELEDARRRREAYSGTKH